MYVCQCCNLPVVNWEYNVHVMLSRIFVDLTQNHKRKMCILRAERDALQILFYTLFPKLLRASPTVTTITFFGAMHSIHELILCCIVPWTQRQFRRQPQKHHQAKSYGDDLGAREVKAAAKHIVKNKILMVACSCSYFSLLLSNTPTARRSCAVSLLHELVIYFWLSGSWSYAFAGRKDGQCRPPSKQLLRWHSKLSIELQEMMSLASAIVF